MTTAALRTKSIKTSIYVLSTSLAILLSHFLFFLVAVKTIAKLNSEHSDKFETKIKKK